jgi:predicted phosphodiesterase
MRIGVVSDTHNRLPNVRRIVDLLNAAGVERVIHTGDITQARTLHAFGGLDASLIGVFGNNDEREPLLEAARDLGFALNDGPLELLLAETRIVVVHDPRELAGAPSEHDVAPLRPRPPLRDRPQRRPPFFPGMRGPHGGLERGRRRRPRDLEVELLRF